MQELLPIIKTTILQWAQATVADPLYAATLVVLTGTLMSILCSLKGIPLRAKAAASEKACSDLSQELAQAQHQTSVLQAKVDDQTNQIYARLRVLNTNFELGEQLDVQGGEDVWSRQDRIFEKVTGIIVRERNAVSELKQMCRSETDKCAEQEVFIATLQKEVAEKQREFSALQQAAKVVHDQHQQDRARLAELERETIDLAKMREQLAQLEQKLSAKEVEINQLEIKAASLQAQSVKTADDLPITEVSATAEGVQPQASEHTASISDPVVEEAQPEVEVGGIERVEPTKSDFAANLAGFLKNLFIKAKTEPKPVEGEIPVASTEESVESEQPASVTFAQSQLGKIKGLFSSPKIDYPVYQDEIPSDVAESIDESPLEIEAEAETPPQSPSQFSKIRTLFGFSKPESQPVEVEETVLVDVALESEAEASESSVSYAKRQIGKITQLFGISK